MRWIASSAVVLVVGLGGWFFWHQESDRDELIFLRVGQGDSTLIRAGGRVILIDTGPTSDAMDAGERVVAPAVSKQGGRLDLIILTHPDLDHVGGTGAVLKRFPAAKLMISAVFKSHPELNANLKKWQVRGDQVIWVDSQRRISVGNSIFRITAPPTDPFNDNVGSLLIHLTMSGQTALFTGDATSDTEAWALGREDWRASVLKAGHHGSATSTSDAWLKAVQPTWAVISCGRGNRYGHPAKEVVDRLNEAGVKIKRTDQDGEICFQPSNEGWLPCR